MNRTYNVFVDNGLFVLSYYLQKEVKDIVYEDIVKSIDNMVEKIVSFVQCKKYSSIIYMMFPNSPLANNSVENPKESLSNKLKSIHDDKGMDTCFICGKTHANVINEISRSLYPNIVSHTFYNYSNNLKGVNICPYCLILTIYSILNVNKGESLYFYNSDSNEFLEDYTIKKQEEVDIDIISKASKLTKNPSTYEAFQNLTYSYTGLF